MISKNYLIEDFNVKKAYILNNDNVCIKNERIYLPIYMIMFLKNHKQIDDQIVIPDISSLQ